MALESARTSGQIVFLELFQMFARFATSWRRAARCGTPWWLVPLAAVALACASPGPPPPRIHTLPQPPGSPEHYCAWYGEARGPTLYVGISAFWSSSARHAGDATADLQVPGPQWVGRFDLASERWLEPLRTSEEPRPGGTWDVLPRPDGRVAFTTFFGSAGRVAPDGTVERFEAAGTGLAEIAPGPGEGLVAARYREEGGAVVLSDAGEPVAWLASPRPAPAKSAVWDAGRGWVWILADRPQGSGWPQHPAWAVDLEGRPRIALAGPEPHPELQFARFDARGAGHLALVQDDRLVLRPVAPGEPLDLRDLSPLTTAPPAILLDDAFAASHDFVQDLQLGPDGRLVVTRWSGIVHVVSPGGEVRTRRLPRGDGTGPDLYYTGVLVPATRDRPERLCATRCRSIEVVCSDW